MNKHLSHLLLLFMICIVAFFLNSQEMSSDLLSENQIISKIENYSQRLNREELSHFPITTKEGKIIKLTATSENGGEVDYSVFETDEGSYDLYSLPEVSFYEPGARVRLNAYQINDEILVAESVQLIEPPVLKAPTQLDVLVITFNFQNNTDQPFTRSQIAEKIFSNSDSTNNFYQDSSFDNVTLNGDINNVTSSWYTVPYNSGSGCDYTANIANWTNSANAQATSAGYNLANYERKMYVFPRNTSCGWAGLGQVPGTLTWFNEYNISSIYSHELGHNFGAGHSGDLDCGAVTINNYASCSTTVYGDDYDVMGNVSQGHMNAIWKNVVGWVSNEKMLEVTESGTYTIEDIETLTTGYQGIVIEKPNTSDYYVFDYHQAVGQDSFLPNGVTRGLIGRLYTNAFDDDGNAWDDWDTFIMDMTPANDWTDIALSNGTSYIDSENEITVTQVSANINSVTIDVSFGDSYTANYYCDDALSEPISENAVITTTSVIWSGGGCDIVDNKVYIKLSFSNELVTAPTISIDSQGLGNDITSAATTLISGNDYKYTRTISADSNTDGTTFDLMTVSGESSIYGAFSNLAPENPTYQPSLEVSLPALQSAKIVKNTESPYNRQLRLDFSEEVTIIDDTGIISPSFTIDGLVSEGEYVLFNISGIEDENTGFTSSNLTIPNDAVSDNWLNYYSGDSGISVEDGVSPIILSAEKIDTQLWSGIQAGDKVAVTFSEDMSQSVISNTNINDKLPLLDWPEIGVSETKSWLDGLGNIGSASWISASVLEIVLSDGVSVPDFGTETNTIDTGYSSQKLTDVAGNLISSGVPLTGSFSPPVGSLDHINISPSTTQNISSGQTIQFTAQGKDQYNNNITDLIYTWTGTNALGLFNTTTAGSYSVYVSSSGVDSNTVVVNVAETSSKNPVYRFWSDSKQAHFYTISESEKNYVIATWPDIWKYEGVAYYGYSSQANGSYPVYRFWSDKNQKHFYTISETEKNYIIKTWPHIWKYEKVAYYAHPNSTSETRPVYRFWSDSTRGHFYTSSETEKNYIIKTWPHIWKYERVAYHAPK